MRVVIAEDSVLLREGLVAAARRGRLRGRGRGRRRRGAARAPSTSTSPTWCVVDVRMPPTFTDEGLRAALVIRRQRPDIAVLVLSQYVEERYAAELLAGDTERRRLPAQGPRRRRRASSSTRCAGWPPAAPRSTPRWSRQLLVRRGAATRWTG